MLRIDASWVWDFWLADDGARHHVFYLQAPRSLPHADHRHHSARVGHAVSTDLRSWTLLDDALIAGSAGSFDAQATWTGSVLRGPDQQWYMFYTGLTMVDGAAIQQIGLATSADLSTWTKHPCSPLVRADPRWYETVDRSPWHQEAWRDPWVFADPGGDGWHMLITARSNTGDPDDRGVVGHATSADLLHWQVAEPLSAPGAGFGQLEVLQVEVVDGAPVLLFSCLSAELAGPRARAAHTGGVWAVTAAKLLGPYDVSSAQPLTDDSLYSGRLVQDRAGSWNLLAFHNRGERGFVGELSEPMPIEIVRDRDGGTELRLLNTSTRDTVG